MSMTSNGRRDAIYNAIAGSDPNFSKLSTSEKNALKASIGTVWGTGDLSYITANAQVSSSVTVTSVSGVTAGGASSGPGSGSATGTVS